MENFHVIPTRETKRTGIKFVIGRVRHHIDSPEDYEIKVIKKGMPKIILGQKGIYVLNDYLTEKFIKEIWESYLKRYKQRGSRAKTPIVEPPIEASEEELREFLLKENITPCLDTGWISFESKDKIATSNRGK